MTAKKITVCAAHAAPVYLDADATVDKACELISQAAARGVDLLAFPESFVPGFPIWPAVSPPFRNHALFERLVEESIRVPGPEVLRLCEAARRSGVIVSIGLSESTDSSVGCIWNSNLIIGADGAILNHHRKLVPTFFEKLVWANGDGAGLRVLATDVGRLGMLICGENTNPLARYALMADGEQVHISSYPPVWPTHDPRSNDAYDLRSAIRIRAGAHSFEAKAFNVVVSSIVDERTLEMLSGVGAEGLEIVRNSPRGVSMIIDPKGSVTAETDAASDELLIADIDLAECVVPKQFHDVAGYYNRFDIFNLTVDRERRIPIAFEGASAGTGQSFDAIRRSVGRRDAAE